MNCPALRELFASELVDAETKGKLEGGIEKLFDLVQKKYLPLEIGAMEAGLSLADFSKKMAESGFVVPYE